MNEQSYQNLNVLANAAQLIENVVTQVAGPDIASINATGENGNALITTIAAKLASRLIPSAEV